MSLFERIQFLVQKNGLTIGGLERLCGFSNGTIRKWATQNPTLEKVMIVADKLNVSLQYLASGEETKISSADLSEGEQEILKQIKGLTEFEKVKLSGAISMLIFIQKRERDLAAGPVGEVSLTELLALGTFKHSTGDKR